MSDLFDVIVVGAGLMGSSAAYYASAAHQRVLLLEQFDLLHKNGSSHGTSRIFRVAYTNGVYTKMCIDSLKMWRDIEQKSGQSLIEMTGELDFVERAHSEQLDEVAAVLESNQQPHEVLTGSQVNSRFPGFALPANSHAIFSPNAGILNPTLAMQTLQELASQQGAEIRGNSRVSSISQVEGSTVAVTLTTGDCFRAKQCIVTAGPWTKKLLEGQPGAKCNIAIRPIATYGTYWKCNKDNEEDFTPSKFPVFINYEDPWVYGLPMQDPSEGVKVCMHSGPNVDPDDRQNVVNQPEDDVAKVQQFLQRYMPHIDSSAVTKVDLCMYSMTKDEDFILDFVPAPQGDEALATDVPKQLIVGAGFSGHGAKMTPVIGKILADLAIYGKTAYPIDKFAISRLA